MPAYELVSPFELVPYMAAGIIAGFVAVAFVRSLGFTEDLFERLAVPEWSKAAIGGLMVGSIGDWLPNV